MDYENNEDLTWEISTGCENVELASELFDVEQGYDFVTIEGDSYTGYGYLVREVPPNFTLSFRSDSSQTGPGFIFNWYCV